ncbi:MAG: hypothetical protein CO079_10270 [Nitrosopumilales archaeon CG_4_9_14_0_8_um_filter_34_10]|nr:MAG: hypothetical protein CO079_10270 [Nitrosopumilales archaeon CG_4_9_14_0_8_um_filter_34_10]
MLLMTEQIYPCNEDHMPSYEIIFSVAGTEKTYLVCKECATFDYFSKYIIKKEKIDPCLVTNEE